MKCQLTENKEWLTIRIVDLRSDTTTLPSLEMREAMARSRVGDDVYVEDPTVNLLQEEAARWWEKRLPFSSPAAPWATITKLELPPCGPGLA